ncbi:MAG: ABC transporter substrate-binding protein [Candidatus Dormibacteraeota bacterium]|nr:ABC transporter substrate-binding protein [Candidatus Dormibacteraeota bacterium]
MKLRSRLVNLTVGGLLVLLTACTSSGGTAANAPGVTDDSILLGGTTPLSGSASAYAVIAKAVEAYFKYQNDQGGVNGRKITYKYLDDAYNPAQTIPLTKQLVEQDKVFAMFQGLGTQPQTAVRQYLNDQKVPQLFVATGASTWGKDHAKYPQTIGWQPNYVSESIVYGRQIVANSPSAKIGVLYQNDDYGQDYLEGFTTGLGSKASQIISKQSYEATAADVKSQVAALRDSGADTFFIIATPKYSIQAMATAFGLGWHPATYLNSVSASTSFMKAVIKATGKPESVEGIVSTQYLKDPSDPSLASDPGITLYKDILTKYLAGADPTDNNQVYGMAVAFTMIDVLKVAGKGLTREGVLKAADNLNETDNPFLLKGVVVKTASDFHYPLTQEQLIKWTSGRWVSFGDVIDTRADLPKS